MSDHDAEVQTLGVKRIYQGWDVLGGLVRTAARSIENEVGRDVLDYIIREGRFDSFIKQELTEGRDEDLGDANGS